VNKNIQHRHVFYVSGFDPRGAAFYHRTFKEESAKQTKINGIEINVQPRKKHSDFSQAWKIAAKDQGQQVETQYEFLRWDDIVRKHWVKSLLSIFLDFIYVSWVFITTGTLKRVANASRTPAITGLYPAVFIAVSGLLAILLWFATVVIFTAFQLAWLGWVLGSILCIAVIIFSKMWGDRINVFWLLRIYAFTSRWASGEIKELDDRITVFAEHICVVLKSHTQDEVILIGHSVGSMLTVAIAARVAEMLDKEQVKQPLNMITLGECIPLLSLLPKAVSIRNDLSHLSCSNKIQWVDYTSPADGACFPLVDPVKVSLSKASYCHSPTLLSARFHKLFKAGYYQKIRKNFYQMHFLYLMSNDHLGQYDYFAMTAGKQSLKARIAQQYQKEI